MGASIHDVAKLAGVSPRTVSNVVNDFVHVRESTRERVRAAIAELNYHPNISARRLRQGRTRMLGFAVPELAQPYFAELSELIEEAARERDYTVIATGTAGSLEREQDVLRSFGSHMVDGLVFSPMAMTKADLLQTPPNVPTVLIGEQINSSRFASIAIDNVRATADITRHLLDRGHRRIATLGAYHSDLYRSSRLRLEGYRAALDEAGVPFDPELVLYTDRFGRRAGRNGVSEAWRAGTRFDAIVCFTDMLALGAIRAFADLGVQVPGDVAIASIDDVKEAEFAVPSLTTISPDKRAIAQHAVDTLLQLLDDEDAAPDHVEIGYRLIARESSGPEPTA